MRIVAALGGNALLRRGEPPEATVQLAHLTEAVRGLAPLLDHHEVLLTHGNGPQIGLLAIESASDPGLSTPYPLDALDAQTQGMIGYWLTRELRRARPKREVVALLTQTVVRADDPAFEDPTKFIGRVYADPVPDWTMRRDGAGWRRVVPSPEPQDIVELPVIRRLLDAGCVVVAAGGGGVPVIDTPDGPQGVEGVVDKDLTASLLAERLDADVLLLLTDVPAISYGYGTLSERPSRRSDPMNCASCGCPPARWVRRPRRPLASSNGGPVDSPRSERCGTQRACWTARPALRSAVSARTEPRAGLRAQPAWPCVFPSDSVPAGIPARSAFR